MIQFPQKPWKPFIEDEFDGEAWWVMAAGPGLERGLQMLSKQKPTSAAYYNSLRGAGS